MVISAIWSILPGQNRGPYIRNPVYLILVGKSNFPGYNVKMTNPFQYQTQTNPKDLNRFCTASLLTMRPKINEHHSSLYVRKCLSLFGFHRVFSTTYLSNTPHNFVEITLV